MSGHGTYDPKLLHVGMLQSTFVVWTPAGQSSPCIIWGDLIKATYRGNKNRLYSLYLSLRISQNINFHQL